MSVRGLNHADTPCSELWQSAAQIAWRHHEPCPSRPSVRRSLKAFYLVTEQYDAVAISEVPNDETVAKLSLRTAALDNVRTETLRAFNEDEYRKIVASIGQIRRRPPRGRPSRCGPMLMWSPRLRPTSRQRPSRARSQSPACLRRLLRPRSDDRDELATSLLDESGRAAFPLAPMPGLLAFTPVPLVRFFAPFTSVV